MFAAFDAAVGVAYDLVTGLASALHGLVFLALFALLAAVAWWTSRRTDEGRTPPAGTVGKVMCLLPFGTIAVTAYVPLAAGLYLLTSTAWAAAERALLWRGATAN